MPADTVLKDAWSRIPSLGAAETAFERFTGKRMERILATVVAIGSAVLGTQAMFAAIGAMASGTSAIHVTLLVIVYVPLIAMLVACVIGRGVRLASGSFAVVYLVALASWPLTVGASDHRSVNQPWIFFLVNVGVAAAMLAFPVRIQMVWAVCVPVVYGYVRLVEGEFTGSFWTQTAFDVSFTLILGVVILSLGWMFRSVAAGVDDARGRAVASYAGAAAAAAAEEERVAMAALMHDSVLAALTRLANTEAAVAQEGSDEPVGTAQIVIELRRALSELGADAIVEERGGSGLIPGRVARALVLAARQAIGNAVTHAHGRGLHLVVEGYGDDGVTVTVMDTGGGFDMDAIGEDRLGIRASIVARMAGVAGTATIDSDGDGTTVVLGWRRE
ncbi:hypothetical protein GCM10027421_35350 [Microbacterium shaanxiense]